MDRLESFRSFIARAPGDPFPRYGLAMELKTRGDLDGAWSAFTELVTSFPDYVPTYLMAGGTLVALSRKAEAADVFIEKASKLPRVAAISMLAASSSRRWPTSRPFRRHA